MTICLYTALVVQSNLATLYKKVITALHRQKCEDDREDAARLKALHDVQRAQAEELEKL
jgi:hypothetical protein